MKTKVQNQLPIKTFKNPGEFEAWLSEHYQSKGVWLRIFKKAADTKGITNKEALDVALCYGWIDGQRKKHDEQSYLQKYTPRTSASLWSKRNVQNIIRLTELGKMKPSGTREVERAKSDGRWDNAYDPPSEMKMPDDFMQKLEMHPEAKTFFESLNKSNRYNIAWRLQTARTPETRDRRLKVILERLSKGKKFI